MRARVQQGNPFLFFACCGNAFRLFGVEVPGCLVAATSTTLGMNVAVRACAIRAFVSPDCVRCWSDSDCGHVPCDEYA